MTMTPPDWRPRLEALLLQHIHLPSSTFVQVATVRRNGRPANRTMTFRFFLDDDRMLFTADMRTEKVAELAQNPWAELCWYFVDARVQMRLLGTMQVMREDEDGFAQVRQRSWSERTEASRQSFTWPAAGEPLAAAETFEHAPACTPPDTFGLLVFSPCQVETLDLSCQPHSRVRHTVEANAWTAKSINP